jgi:hypothetical protein
MKRSPSWERFFIPTIYFAIEFKYSSSTLLRAQGVRRRNFRLDLILGSLKKQRMGMRFDNSTQPYCWTSCVRIISRVIACKGLLGCGFGFMAWFLFVED